MFSAALASNLGDGVVSVAIAFAVLDTTGSATHLGLVLAARVIALVGPLSDAIGLFEALYVCGTVQIAALLAMLALRSVRTLAPAPAP